MLLLKQKKSPTMNTTKPVAQDTTSCPIPPAIAQSTVTVPPSRAIIIPITLTLPQPLSDPLAPRVRIGCASRSKRAITHSGPSLTGPAAIPYNILFRAKWKNFLEGSPLTKVNQLYGKSFFGAEARPSNRETHRREPRQRLPPAQRPALLPRDLGRRRQESRERELWRSHVGDRQGRSEGFPAQEHRGPLQEPPLRASSQVEVRIVIPNVGALRRSRGI